MPRCGWSPGPFCCWGWWRGRALLRGGPVWPGARGRLVGAAALLAYLFGFSLAYGALDAGVGALILFGMVQITMFGGALLRGEAVPVRRWLGAALAFGGLVLLLAPGGAAGLALHAVSMAVAGVGWGIYSLAGRGQADALGATAWNFALAVPVALALGLVLPGKRRGRERRGDRAGGAVGGGHLGAGLCAVVCDPAGAGGGRGPAWRS